MNDLLILFAYKKSRVNWRIGIPRVIYKLQTELKILVSLLLDDLPEVNFQKKSKKISKKSHFFQKKSETSVHQPRKKSSKIWQIKNYIYNYGTIITNFIF